MLLPFALWFLTFTTMQGQYLNKIWYSGITGTPWDLNDTLYTGGNIINFFVDTVAITREFRKMNFSESHTVKSNAIGEVDFYSNGMYIANKNNDTMVGGTDLNPGYYRDAWAADKIGYRLRDGIILVPDLNLPNHYRLFHKCISDNVILPDQILTTLIDLDGDDGLGAVVEKNKIVYENKNQRLSQSHFNAVRHANGRDWWLVNILYATGDMLLHLYTPDSIYQFIGIRGFDYEALWDDRFGVGQCQFSPDGSKFATVYSRRKNMNYQASIEYYLFDRCLGEFAPFFFENAPDNVSQHGVSFSQDSRYLYESNMNYLNRYDTEGADVFASKDTIAEWDGYHWNPVQGQNWPTRLGFSEIGPNGIIYLHTSSGSPYMHKVLHPTLPDSTEVIQHFRIPAVNTWTISNYPNYQLGAVDGPCANMVGPPTALFAWEADMADVTYTDQSVGVPLSWQWDFGDGATSAAQHPQHPYLNDGTYTVCLTASNIYGSDTWCQEVAIKTTAVKNLHSELPKLRLTPNPATEQVTVTVSTDVEGAVTLYDMAGRQIVTTNISQGRSIIDTKGMPSGAYTVHVTFTNGGRLQESLIIQR